MVAELLTLRVKSHFGEWWKVEETVVVLSVSLDIFPFPGHESVFDCPKSLGRLRTVRQLHAKAGVNTKLDR